MKTLDEVTFSENETLNSLTDIFDEFFILQDTSLALGKILKLLIKLTDSEFGIIGELVDLDSTSASAEIKTLGYKNIYESENDDSIKSNLIRKKLLLHIKSILDSFSNKPDEIFNTNYTTEKANFKTDEFTETFTIYTTTFLTRKGTRLIVVVGSKGKDYKSEQFEKLKPLIKACSMLVDQTFTSDNTIQKQNGFLETIEKLESKKKELERKNYELEQFAYVASHDLQEPLRTISSFTHLLTEEYSEILEGDGLKYLEFINSSTNRMSFLIRDLLEYSRIGSLKSFEIVNMDELLQEVACDLNQSLIERSIQICLNPLPAITGIRLELKLLFQNLISNAIKFSSHSKRAEIEINYKENEEEWIFSVSDNGIGIEKEYMDKIFVIFQRLHTSAEYPGTGIGLAKCQKIAEIHNGKIWVDSTFGKGSTFFTSLSKNI